MNNIYESLYQERLSNGMKTWNGREYDDFSMHKFVKLQLGRLNKKYNSCNVLDLGCGTGNVSSYFANLGFNVYGTDISDCAINKAKEFAKIRELPINFFTSDLIKDELPKVKFDIVIDSSFSHCIVDNSHRNVVFTKIRESLKENGELWSKTMVGLPKIRKGGNYYINESGILFQKFKVNKKYIPYRRIHLSINNHINDFKSFGFRIINKYIIEAKHDIDTSEIILICNKV